MEYKIKFDKGVLKQKKRADNSIFFYDEIPQIFNSNSIEQKINILNDKVLYSVSYYANKYNQNSFLKYNETFWHRIYYPYFYKLLSIIEVVRYTLIEIEKKYSKHKIIIEKPKILYNDLENESDLTDNFSEDLLCEMAIDIIKFYNLKTFLIIENQRIHKIKINNYRNRISINKLLYKLLDLKFEIGYGISLIDSIILTNKLVGLNFPYIQKNLMANHYKSLKRLEYVDILHKYIPNSLKIIDNKIEQTRKTLGNKKILRVINNLGSVDLSIRIKYALEEFSGSIIIPIQHGGHLYGSSKIHKYSLHTDLFYNYFISWGWSRLKDQAPKSTNVLDLPSPYISKLINTERRFAKKIILVSTEESLIHHRFEHILTSTQIKKRFEDKTRLIKFFIDNPNIKDFYFRPYFPSSFNEDYLNEITKMFPKILILKGNLNKQLKKCRYIIIDHPGTTLNYALALNIPVFMMFKKEDFNLSKTALRIYAKFEDLKILHSNFESFKKFLEKNQYNPNKYWESKSVQNIRKEFCSIYATTSDNWIRDFKRILAFENK